MKSLRARLIRLAHQNAEVRPHLLPLLREAAAQNPVIVPWGDRFAVRFVTRRGETLWTGDGWRHAMDFVRDDAPVLFASRSAAAHAVTAEVLPYIARWQPGYWDDFVRGWDAPAGMTPR